MFLTTLLDYNSNERTELRRRMRDENQRPGQRKKILLDKRASSEVADPLFLLYVLCSADMLLLPEGTASDPVAGFPSPQLPKSEGPQGFRPWYSRLLSALH